MVSVPGEPVRTPAVSRSELHSDCVDSAPGSDVGGACGSRTGDCAAEEKNQQIQKGSTVDGDRNHDNRGVNMNGLNHSDEEQ
ncbi:hypothetical protein P4O66_023124, partial [Electrophorus voltai]